MKKILVVIENNCMYFSKYNREISQQNLNNTNVINAKNLKFTEEYISENLELISTFFNLLTIKFKVDKVVIKDLEIAEISVILINSLSAIKHLIFKEDTSINYTVSTLLLENKNLQRIECYNLPEVMFYKFNDNVIKTRSSVLSTSDFFDYNKIITLSDIYNKKTIVVPKLFSQHDIMDLKYFFQVNKNLKKVEFNPYNRINLETVLKLLKKNHLKKVSIVICEEEKTTNEILKDIKFFDELNEKYNVDIRIKYSKKYKEKNKKKEFFIILLKYVVLTTIISSSFFLLRHIFLDKKNSVSIENNIEKINEIVNEEVIDEVSVTEEVIEETSNTSPYYQNYSNSYEKLTKLNKDTVGWITLNNTKINYPVVQSNDNKYYLNRAFDNSINNIGWIFVDYRNNMDDLDKNTIIYGHSMIKGGLMFSTLKNVLESNWYNNEKNLIIDFSVKDKKYKWQIFSIYSIQETIDYLYTDFNSDEEFIKFVDELKFRSIKNFNIKINSKDKILTLSTCHNDNQHRVVVHAKLI